MNDHNSYNADGKVLYTLVMVDEDNKYSNSVCGTIYYIGSTPKIVWNDFLDHIKKFGTIVNEYTT